MTWEAERLFLGFDLSTQQLKVIVSDEKLKPIETFSVEFDKYYAEKYDVTKGVKTNDETGEVLSPVAMWLDSLEKIFDIMKNKNFPFKNVVGMSGSCQQHGSVYWSTKAPELLSSLKEGSSLSEQLADALAYDFSPNWQDHSTGEEIKAFESATGGPDGLAEITGSRAHYRFTGLQIRKLAHRNKSGVYKNTHRISLVSSFLASVLLGAITNIEQAEACGMNLYDIANFDYDDNLLAVAAGVDPKLDGASQAERDEGVKLLKEKLGEIKPISYEASGAVCNYFVKKYGFNKDAKVYAFTGDNLATILSLPLAPNDILISLGTSTTVLLITKNYKPSSQYHLFLHPTMKEHFMGMICYCNGALAREKVRNAVNAKCKVNDPDSWDKFDEILDSSKMFDHKLGIYFPLGEIVPNASAQFLRCKLTESNELVEVDKWDPEEDVSSIVESQTLSCRLRAGPMLVSAEDSSSLNTKKDKYNELYERMHLKFGDLSTDGKRQNAESLTSRPRKVFFVGGASRNVSIVRKMGSILGATEGNYKVEIPNACALGGAYKASWSFECERLQKWVPYEDYISSYFEFDELENIKVPDAWDKYFDGVGMLAKMEQKLNHD